MSAGIRDALSKLKLEKGDILVVSDQWVRDALLKMRPPEGIDFPVPVVYAPEGTLRKCRREELEEALNMLDKDVTVASGTNR